MPTRSCARLLLRCSPLILAAACGGSADAGPSGPRLPVATVAGTWTVTFTDVACVAGPLTFSVPGTDDDVQPFGSLTFASTWSTAAASGPLVGTINVITNVVTLHFLSADGFTGAASIEGSLDDQQKLSGNFTDPYAAALPLFGTACQALILGQRG